MQMEYLVKWRGLFDVEAIWELANALLIFTN